MNPRLQWLALFVLAAVGVAYAAYESRGPGRCAYEHTGVCNTRGPFTSVP